MDQRLRWRRVGWLLAALWPLAGPAAGDWAQPNAPFRAVFKVLSKPDLEEAGYFLEVPICGLGDDNGETVSVCNEAGEDLLVRALGRTRQNAALVVAAGRVKTQLYAYFGGEARAPQMKTRFKPGLVAEYRAVPPGAPAGTWEQAERLLKQSRLLGVVPVDHVELAGNPLDTTAPVAVDISGFLKAEKPDSWSLFVVTGGPGYLLVDDKVVIDRGRGQGGDAAYGGGREVVRVRKGELPIRVVSVAPPVVLARFEDERRKYALPAAAFVQSGRTQFEKIETAGNAECPAFRYQALSYLGVGDDILTEVEFSSLTGQALTWRCANGLQTEGNKVRLILVGTAGVPVEAKGKKLTARGVVNFSEVPRAGSWTNPADCQRFAAAINGPNLKEVDLPTLQAYLRFFKFFDRNEAAVPTTEAILDHYRAKVLDATARDALLTLARCAAASQPARAREAWDLLMRHHRLNDDPDLGLEYWEFLAYRQADLERAGEVAAELVQALGKKDPQAQRCLGETALLKGDLPAATATFDKLRWRIAGNDSFRVVGIQATSLLEQQRKTLAAGYLYQAERELREWSALAPEALTTGQYALVRAQLLRRNGWPEGALRLVEATLKLNDLLPFMPDLEFEQALALFALKRTDEAKAVCRHLVEAYPKHPVAAAAQKLLP